jgi:hypothetical protein
MEQNLKEMGSQFGCIQYNAHLTAETYKKASAIQDDLNGSLETIANFDDSLPTFETAKYDSKSSEDRYTT